MLLLFWLLLKVLPVGDKVGRLIGITDVNGMTVYLDDGIVVGILDEGNILGDASFVMVFKKVYADETGLT